MITEEIKNQSILIMKNTKIMIIQHVVYKKEFPKNNDPGMKSSNTKRIYNI